MGSLGAGRSFGELALLSPHNTRAATIRASTNCYFAVLNKDDYQKVYGEHQEKILNRKIDFFKSMPLFCNWTRDSLRKLTPFFEETEYKRNAFVINEGDDYDGVST